MRASGDGAELERGGRCSASRSCPTSPLPEPNRGPEIRSPSGVPLVGGDAVGDGAAFDITAERRPHFGFGGGAHPCIGHWLTLVYGPGGVWWSGGASRVYAGLVSRLVSVTWRRGFTDPPPFVTRSVPGLSARRLSRDLPDASGDQWGQTRCMTRDRQTRHGVLFWAGVTLFALWNVGMLLLAIASAREYESCMAEEGFNICFDYSGAILFVLSAVDSVVALIAAVVHWLRVRRDRPPA